MRGFLSVSLTAVMALGSVLPLSAQEGDLEIAYFLTVRDENVTELAEGIRAHTQWHRDQGDPWTWAVWQAVTGEPEFVYVSQGHTWADLDDPGVDLAHDQRNWEETGAPHTESATSMLWRILPGLSRPPGPDAGGGLAQVVEFRMNPGGEEAFFHVLEKYRDAAAAVVPEESYIWAEVVAGPEGTTHFVVLPAGSFADFGLDRPSPPEILIEHYGMTEARRLLEMFNDAVTHSQTRIWALRPDLSHGMD